MRWGNRSRKQGRENTEGGIRNEEKGAGGRADWLRRRPPREAERGGTTSGLERGGQSPSFGGARREWSHSGIVGRGEQQLGPALD